MEKTEMSSEQTEKDLAQEALDATETSEETLPDEESAEKKAEPTVPLHELTALRAKKQEAEVRAATAEGKLIGMQEARTKEAPAVKSPLEVNVERQRAEGIEDADMTITPAVYRAQQLHEKQIASQAAETTAKQALGATQLKSAAGARGKHDDWQTVINTGEVLLTPGELMDISNAGADFGEKAYEKCKAAIEANKPESEKKSETTPNEELESKSNPEVPSQTKILKDLNVDDTTAAAAQL